nr:hypothetical protein [Paracoccus mutanolyticus]
MALKHLLSALQTPAPAMAMASLDALPGMPGRPKPARRWPARRWTGARTAAGPLPPRPPLAEITGRSPVNAPPMARHSPSARPFAALLPDCELRQGLQTRQSRRVSCWNRRPTGRCACAMTTPAPLNTPPFATGWRGGIREGEPPWRPARILMVLGVSDGRYPRRPAGMGMISFGTRGHRPHRLRLDGRSERLARDQALFRRQIAGRRSGWCRSPAAGAGRVGTDARPGAGADRALHRRSRRPRPAGKSPRACPLPAPRPRRSSPLRTGRRQMNAAPTLPAG